MTPWWATPGFGPPSFDQLGAAAMERGNALILLRPDRGGIHKRVICWSGKAEAFWWSSVLMRQPTNTGPKFYCRGPFA